MKLTRATSQALSLIHLVSFLFAFAFWLATGNVAQAVDACSEPIGSVAITLLTNSDTFVSIPYTRAPLFCGTVQSVSGNAVTVQGAPGWTDGQWSQVTTNGYFPDSVVLTSGAQEGATFGITNNSPDTLLLATGGCYDLTGVSAGDQLAIIPYWTLGTVFPGGAGVTPSTLVLHKTELLFFFPCPHCSGLPNPTVYIYYFYNSHWRKVGASSSSNYDDAVLLPEQFFIVRQNSTAPTSTFTATGNVVQYATRTCLYADSVTTNWDNFVANYHSTTQTLDQANLAAAFLASDPGTNPPTINDLLFVYDNTTDETYDACGAGR